MNEFLQEQAKKVKERNEIAELGEAILEATEAQPTYQAIRNVLDNLDAGHFRNMPAADLELENYFIGGALSGSFDPITYRWLNPKLFTGFINQILWAAMCIVVDGSEDTHADNLSIGRAVGLYKSRIEKFLGEERKPFSYEVEYIQQQIPEYYAFSEYGLNYSAMAQMISEMAKLRECEAIACEMLKASRKIGVTPEMITERYTKRLRSLMGASKQIAVSTPVDSLSIIERMRRKESVPHYKTGIPDFDKMVQLRRKEHVMVAGRASDGKSVLCKQIVLALCEQDRLEKDVMQDDSELFIGSTLNEENKPKPSKDNGKLRALIIFTEDTTENYHLRCLAELARVPVDALLKGYVPADPSCKDCKGAGEFFDVRAKQTLKCPCWRDYEEEFYERLDKAHARYNKMDIRVIDKRMTTNDLEKTIIEEYKKSPFDLLVLDYIQRLSVAPGQSKYDMVTAASNILTDLAKDIERLNPHGLIVMSAVQINRQGANDSNVSKEYIPQLHHLKDSGDLEQDGHIIFAVARKYNEDGSKSNYGKIHLMKYRNGAVDRPPLGVYLSPHMRFDALDTLHVNAV